MNFLLERVLDPTSEPVTVAEAKTHMRVEISDDDTYIETLITVAREWVEDYTGRALYDQIWRLTLTDGFANPETDENTTTPIYTGAFTEGAKGVLLRKSPVLALVGIISVDSAGTETVLDTADYQLLEADSKWPRLKANTGSTFGGGTLKVTYRAGFADRTGSPTEGAERVPGLFKHAIKMLVAHYYENRELVGPSMSEIPMGVTYLLSMQRSELGVA